MKNILTDPMYDAAVHKPHFHGMSVYDDIVRILQLTATKII